MRPIDIAVFTWINAGAATAPGWIAFAAFVSDVLPAIAVGAFALGAAFKPAWRKPLLAGLVSVLVVWALVSLFRSIVHVPRPAALKLGTQWASQGIRPGFPSMHASASFAFAVSLLMARSGWPGVAVLATAFMVAWSRLFLGLHFPSDVLAGALLGTLVAMAVGLCLRRLWQRAARSRPN